MPVNRLILGDNLEILKSIDKDASNRNYEVIWGDTGEIRSFQDRWAGGISHYIDWVVFMCASGFCLSSRNGAALTGQRWGLGEHCRGGTECLFSHVIVLFKHYNYNASNSNYGTSYGDNNLLSMSIF